jgi:hypothetical protein
MADIFISYASLDRSTVRGLAKALETRGWSVWWDQQSLHPGQRFERIIEEAILSARVVIVVRSQISIQSDWVRDEAALAMNEGKLVPLRIDNAVLPFRFRNIHTLDFSSWTGQTEAEPFPKLLETLSLYLDPPKKEEPPARRSEHRSSANPRKVAARNKYFLTILVTAGTLLSLAIVIAFSKIYLEENGSSSKIPTGDVEFFTFVYKFKPNPSLRVWSRDSSGVWHERYPDGAKKDSFSPVSREIVNNCYGSIVESMKEEGFEVFIPDQGCDWMQPLFRWNNGLWKGLGHMNDVR